MKVSFLASRFASYFKFIHLSELHPCLLLGLCANFRRAPHIVDVAVTLRSSISKFRSLVQDPRSFSQPPWLAKPPDLIGRHAKSINPSIEKLLRFPVPTVYSSAICPSKLHQLNAQFARLLTPRMHRTLSARRPSKPFLQLVSSRRSQRPIHTIGSSLDAEKSENQLQSLI